MSILQSPPSDVRGPTPGLLDTAIPHACEPRTVPETQSTSTGRLIGIDVARALALVGMIAVHVLADTTADGAMTLPYVLSAGKSAALFALLAGVGIALSTGRNHPPRGRRWLGSMASVAVRAVLITLLGLALGSIIPGSAAHVILVSYGVMFLLAMPLLRLRPAVLATLALLIALVVPIASHFLRQSLPVIDPGNPSFASVIGAPAASLREVLLTGTFPAIAWLAYLCAGLAIGRLVLDRRSAAVALVAVGTAVAVTASVISELLLQHLGGLQALAAAAAPIMSREDFADTFVWGTTGTLPTNSGWWLAVLAPHTTTPFDLLHTMGVAVAVLGLTLMLALVTQRSLRPIARFGSMPLSVYTLHLLLLLVPFLNEDGGLAAFVAHLVILGTFVLVWTRFFTRGPLEQVLWQASHAVSRRVAGAPTAQPERALISPQKQ